jgi:hypothetical protein
LMACASNKAITGEYVFIRSKVLLVSLEDNYNEVRRRIRACRLHHDIAAAELAGHLFVKTIDKNLGKLLREDPVTGRLEVGKLSQKIKKAIIARKIDLVALDPFIKTHGVGENNNMAIDAVMQILTELADELNCAIDVPHHITKGTQEAGNADQGRGASAMKDAARLVYTLTPMTTDEAKAMAVPEELRRFLRRIDSGKVNIAPPSAEAMWIKLIGVRLGNGNDIYPNGDEVQTIERWNPPELFADLDKVRIWRILDQINDGLPDGERYSSAASAGDHRAAWRVVSDHCLGKSEAACRQVIAKWLKSGLLFSKDYKSEGQRKERSGLWVDNTKRP